MKKELKLNKATIIRTIALVLSLINQGLAIWLKFTGTAPLAYLIISFIVTIVTVLINAWENNDWTKAATYATQILDALEDGKLTEEEIKELIEKSAENE